MRLPIVRTTLGMVALVEIVKGHLAVGLGFLVAQAIIAGADFCVDYEDRKRAIKLAGELRRVQ